MSKSFTHAGVSKLDGQFKVRFANDALRTKVLIKNGHTDIDIIELKHAMTKQDAIAYMIQIDFANKHGVINAAVQAALEAEVDKRSDKPQSVVSVVKPKIKTVKAVKSTPSMDAIKAKVAAKKAATPQVPAMAGMTPLGIKPKSTVSRAQVAAQLAALEDAPF